MQIIGTLSFFLFTLTLMLMQALLEEEVKEYEKKDRLDKNISLNCSDSIKYVEFENSKNARD